MRSLYRMTVAVGFSVAMAGFAHAEDWQVAKDQEGIQVSLSEVAGSKYKAYRGTTLIKAPLAKVRALQEDAAAACAWIHECRQQKLLKLEGPDSWTYTQFNTPVLVTPRDSVIHVLSSIEADGSILRKLEGVPTFIPEESGFVRVTEVEGFWKLTPKSAGTTEVTYQVHTEPGGSVPFWLANKFVVDAPFNTLKALKALAEKP
jgi:hypothetical protein